MRSMFVLFRWECRRILSNWRQTMAIFLVPSIVLLLALYLFPVLVDYISTGNIGKAPIVLVSPDEYMLSFIKTDSLPQPILIKSGPRTHIQKRFRTEEPPGSQKTEEL